MQYIFYNHDSDHIGTTLPSSIVYTSGNSPELAKMRKYTLNTSGNSPDSLVQTWATALEDGMGVPMEWQVDPHHHNDTKQFVWMQHGYGNMTPTIFDHHCHPT